MLSGQSAQPYSPSLTFAQTLKPHKQQTTGLIEDGDVSDFQFEDQRRTFASRGYAVDPSVDDRSVVSTQAYIGDKKAARAANGDTQATAKRKRDDPWERFKDELRVARPSEEEIEKMAEWAVRRDEQEGDAGAMKKKKEAIEGKKETEHSTLHIKEEFDYQGRTYMHADQTLNEKYGVAPERCFLPKREIHSFVGHSKGVSTIKFLPGTGHLMLSAGLDGKCKLWEFFGGRRLLRTFHGHTKGVRDIAFNNSGSRFVSAGYDRKCRLWDTETGKCIRKIDLKQTPYCVKFHPSPEKNHLFVTGTADKKILCFDTNTGDIIQEYDRHLGAVNSITFVEEGRRMVSTSDDKSIRIWEWDIPVDIKYIADPLMHSMPTVSLHPNKKWMLLQSMDNQIVTFSASDRFRQNKKKTFKGHMCAGYACQTDMSPDGHFVVSGDGDGHLVIWDWKTNKRFFKQKAHENVCIGAFWHPFETSKVVTCGWDGAIKLWD
jgi:pre-mRNA-processing factor 17